MLMLQSFLLCEQHKLGAASSAVFHMGPGDVVHAYVVIKHISKLHPSVIFGQFDGKDDAWDEKDHAPAQTEPEGIQSLHRVGADNDLS